MAIVDELFRARARHVAGVEPGAAEEIEELQRLVGRELPRELRAYLSIAGGNPGNLVFVQTHKTIRPTLADAIRHHRPRRHGSRKERETPAARIFFGDAPGCQDCGPAVLLLAAPPELHSLEIDPENPPVAGYDYDELVLLAPTFAEYVEAAIPGRRAREL